MKAELAIVLFLATISSNIIPSFCDKILVLSFYSSKSHKITYMPLIEELAKRGHNITIITPIKDKEPKPNIREIFSIDADKFLENRFNAFEMRESGEIMNPMNWLRTIADFCELCYEVEAVKGIVKEDFDLVFMQPLFNECGLGIVYRLKAPLILFTPLSVPGSIVRSIGGYFPPSYVSHFFLGLSDEMTFYDRLVNFGSTHLYDSIFAYLHHPRMEEIYRKALGNDIPSVGEIIGNASLILSNGHFSLSRPKPYLPDVIDVGGIHSRPAKPLPKDLEDFVSASGSDGFILFSMGSAVKGDQLPEEKRKYFLRVFSKLKQRVLWKWESEKMANLPENVKLSKWLPQQDLLGHPKCRLFITHCGGGSTEEAIYHGVPLLGIPMFGDQHMNALKAKNLGFLIELNYDRLSEKNLENGIQEILGNRKYKEKVKELSKIFKDQPDDPLNRGVYWVEYVLRHKGAPQLRSASRKLNWIQHHSLDVIGAYLAIIFSVLYLIYSLIRIVVGKVCGCLRPQKIKPKTTNDKKRK